MNNNCFPLEDGPQHLLTPTQRQILRVAKEHVKKGTKGGFICNIIRYLNTLNGDVIGAYDTSCRGLLKRINMALGNDPYCVYGQTLGGWAVPNIRFNSFTDREEYDRKMTLTRLAWIDYMLENW